MDAWILVSRDYYLLSGFIFPRDILLVEYELVYVLLIDILNLKYWRLTWIYDFRSVKCSVQDMTCPAVLPNDNYVVNYLKNS